MRVVRSTASSHAETYHCAGESTADIPSLARIAMASSARAIKDSLLASSQCGRTPFGWKRELQNSMSPCIAVWGKELKSNADSSDSVSANCASSFSRRATFM